MGALLFYHFRDTKVRLINEKKIVNYFQNDMDCVILLCFLYLACFVVSIYLIFIWVCRTLMACAIQQHIYSQDYRRHSVAQLQNTQWQHTGLYNYNGMQIELFHMKWFNYGYINRA